MNWSIVMLVYEVCSPLMLKQRGKCHRTMNAVNAASGRRVVRQVSILYRPRSLVTISKDLHS